VSTVGKALEDELAGKPRDWDGDPCGYRRVPRSLWSRLSAPV
jgi:hypothetical protein